VSGSARPGSWSVEPAVLPGTLGAQAEQLDPMRVDDVARPRLDLAGDGFHPAVFDLGASPAALADDVVVVRRLADDVRVLARGKVETLDEAEFLEQLEGAEDRRSTDTEPASFRLTDEIECGEMVPALRDHLGDDAPRLGHVVAGFVKGVRERKRITHRPDDTESRIRRPARSCLGFAGKPGCCRPYTRPMVDIRVTMGGAQAQLRLTARVVRAILRNPALRRVELAFLLFTTVEYATWIAILLYAYAAIGPASVGLVAVIQLVPAAVVAPLASSLADRLPRRRVLLIGYLAQVVTFGLTWAAMSSMAPPALVVGVGAAAAATLGFTRPTQGALLPSLSRTPEELTAANGLSGTIEGFGMLLGPLAAAAILAIGTPADVFGAATVALLVAAALVAWLPTGRKPVAGIALAVEAPAVGVGAPGSHPSVLEGVRLVTREPGTRIVVGILTLRMIVIGALDVLYILIALEVFGIGDSGAGLLNAAMGLGVVLGGAISFGICGRPRLAPELCFAAVATGVGLVIVGAGIGAAQAAPVLVVVGMGFAGCDVIGRTILQRVTPDALLGRVLGALEGLAFAGLAVGSLAAPFVVAIVGVQGAFIVAGLLLPLGVALSWLGLRAMERVALVPIRAVELLRESTIFAPLPPAELERVARNARWITVDAGEVLIREGDAGDAYYVLESGSLRVTQDAAELRTTQARADGVGEIALLRDVPRTATVTAAAPSILLAIRRALFLEVVAGHLPTRDAAVRVAEARSGSAGS
jgi:MFS family permease